MVSTCVFSILGTSESHAITSIFVNKIMLALKIWQTIFQGTFSLFWKAHLMGFSIRENKFLAKLGNPFGGSSKARFFKGL